MIFHSSKSPIETIDQLLGVLVPRTGLNISFEVSGDLDTGEVSDASITHSRPASGHLTVVFRGPDTPALTARNGELLYALEHVAAKALRLEPNSHDRVSFDADSFKANREESLRRMAVQAAETVRNTEQSYAFPPMTSRERRILHLALSESGLITASQGETPRRYLVVFPENDYSSRQEDGELAATSNRADAIRNAFRRRYSKSPEGVEQV